MAAPVSLNVIVVGAGIAGLSASIALRRAGHTVTIFERAGFSNEVGAAISTCPNASRILKAWDIDANDARAIPISRSYLAEAKTMQKFFEHSWENCEKDYGASWLLFHRHDLHVLLRNNATRVDRPGTPVTILNRANVSTYDPAAGTITLSDGSVHHGDLVIAGDGIHSIAVEHVIGYKNPAKPHGLSIFRFMVPTAAVLEDPETAPMLQGEDTSFKVFPTEDKQRRFVWYPCRHNELQNCAGIHPDNPKYGAVEDWTARIDRGAFFEEFGERLHPKILKLSDKSDDFKLYKLMNREPLSTWFNGRLVVVGDAAHPMLPHQAQGGSQAIEDAAALEVMFSNLGSRDLDTITERLQLFQDARINRASAIQLMSNQGQDQGQMDEASIRRFLPKHIPIPSNPMEFANFNFSHDAIKESKKVFGEFESRKGNGQIDSHVVANGVGIAA